MTLPESAMPIPGYPGYFLDRNANVYSCRTRKGSGAGSGKGTVALVDESKPRKIKTYTNRGGYLCVHLYNQDGKKSRLIHQLVLESNSFFRDEINCVGRHLNGNQMDNRIENLKWGTVKQNGEDKAARQTMKGHNHPSSKLTPDEVVHIRTCGLPTGTLMDMYGLNRSTICRARSGVTYINVQ